MVPATDKTANRDGSGARPRSAWLGRGIAALICVVVLAALVVTGLSWSWGQELEREERLLPGTAIAAVDVGGWSVEEARTMAREVGAEALDREVTLRAEDAEWTVSAEDLGGSTDADEVVAAAFRTTTSASLPDLVRTRWLDPADGFSADIAVAVDEQAVASFVDDLAEDFDREPVDATLTWSGEEVERRPDEPGRRLVRAGAASAVRGSLEGDTADVDLPVEVVAPEVTTEMVEAVQPSLTAAVDQALDRVVTVTHEGQEWPVTARQLGAAPDVAGLLAVALSSGSGAEAGAPVAEPVVATSAGAVELSLPSDAVEGFVAGIAGEVDVEASNAWIDYSTGWVRIRPERAGQAVERESARERLEVALRGGEDVVDLPVAGVSPDVTTSAYKRVLLVRQSERRLYLYVDGEISRSWDVAVGGAGHATPTGRFTVGAKRHSPTWHNPSPNGWGADMPAVIPPGPTNPLGLRALNWTRGGRDTLIRFHGTANLSSIGSAASKGCVRLRNSDIVELYDLVPSGTAIVSI